MTYTILSLLVISISISIILYIKLNRYKKILLSERNTLHITQQLNKIKSEKKDLELAFKKSSKNHIILQKALRQIEIQNKELEIANNKIQQSNKMKEIFLANTSHEIRTPLNAIIGFTDILSESPLNTKQHQYIEYIKTSSNNLMVIINDILDISKIESGKLIFNKIDFNLKDLIKQTVNTLHKRLQEKQIKIKYDISSNIPNILIGDPVRLNQIIINLLGNSIKFTNNNGLIKLIVTVSSINNNSVKLIFKIEDNGIGIHSDKLNHIFESFTQAENDPNRKYGGTGLGLAIVKQLIELQNGKIMVESERNKGTAFTFYIILEKSTNKKIDNNNKTDDINPSNIDNLNILLVEDNIINQTLTYDILKLWNNNIYIDIADNGEIALNRIEQNNYDLILMDIQMPIMDGNETTKKIRNLTSNKNKIPIIAMTAHALRNEQEDYLNNGMTDYISKPFNSKDLINKIIKHIPHNKK